MNLFTFLEQNNLIREYCSFFDWLFTDKFDQEVWNANRVRVLAKHIQGFEGVSGNSIIYDAQIRLTFPTAGQYKRFKAPTIIMGKGDSVARDWVRHIRNGVAHGNCRAISINGKRYVELLDYRDDKHNQTTAYMFIPLDFLMKTKSVYDMLDDRWKKKDAKEKMKIVKKELTILDQPKKKAV